MARAITTDDGSHPIGSLAGVASAEIRAGGELVRTRDSEAPNSMAAPKYPSAAPQKLGPRAARPVTDHRLASAIAVQEKVLAEISHELGNFFHKLYYWSDFLQERRTRRSADGTASQMLATTIRNFEGFLKLALDYFYPVQLGCMPMAVSDLLRGLLGQLRSQLNGTPLTEADPATWADAAVMVDPGRISQALDIAVRHLGHHVGSGSRLGVVTGRADRGEGPGIEITIELESPNPTSPLFVTAAAGVEWALAERVIALHGGELADREREDGAKAVTLYLPLLIP